jgi:hypothetical protein
MNAGSSIQVFIDPSLDCAIASTNSSHAVCKTNTYHLLLSGELHMSFDRGVRHYTRPMYQYVEDPTIIYAKSGVVSQAKMAGNNLE